MNSVPYRTSHPFPLRPFLLSQWLIKFTVVIFKFSVHTFKFCVESLKSDLPSVLSILSSPPSQLPIHTTPPVSRLHLSPCMVTTAAPVWLLACPLTVLLSLCHGGTTIASAIIWSSPLSSCLQDMMAIILILAYFTCIVKQLYIPVSGLSSLTDGFHWLPTGPVVQLCGFLLIPGPSGQCAFALAYSWAVSNLALRAATSVTSSSCCLCCVSFKILDWLGHCLGLGRSGTPGWAFLFFCRVATIDRRKGEGVDRRSQVTNSVVLLELCVHATNKCKLHHNPFTPCLYSLFNFLCSVDCDFILIYFWEQIRNWGISSVFL